MGNIGMTLHLMHMAKQATELTLAMRKLFDSHPLPPTQGSSADRKRKRISASNLRNPAARSSARPIGGILR